jgi:hypothetical protein
LTTAPAGYYRATSDSHTFEDGDICATPYAIFDNDRLVIHIHPIHKLLLNSNIRNILTLDVHAIVTGDYRRPRTEEHLLADNSMVHPYNRWYYLWE